MPDFTKGKWFHCWQNMKVGKRKRIEIVAGVKVSDGAIKSIANVSGTDTEAQANARLIAKAPIMYHLLDDFVNLDIATDNIKYHVLQTVAAEVLNNINRKDTGHDEQPPKQR